MTDRVFLRLSEGWALGYDRNQWIVMQVKSDKSKPGQRWRAIAFVGSTRAVLMRILREKGAEVAPTPALLWTAFLRRFWNGWRRTTERKRPDGQG